MKRNPVFQRRILLNSRGVSIIEALLLASVLGMATVVMVDTTVLVSKKKKQNDLIAATLSLESDVLGAIADKKNFSAPVLRAQMNDGVTLPPITLKNVDDEDIVTVPTSPRLRADIQPAVAFFDRSKKPCSGFDGDQCVIKLEASLIMTGGPVDPRASEPSPEWIPPGSSTARLPLYGIAYRINVDPAVYSLRNRGVLHDNAFTELDHAWPVPHDHYMALTHVARCSGNGIVVGIDPDTREPYCAEPKNSCSDPTSLAKELIIDGNSIYMDCGGWKSFSCPKDYLPQVFAPTMFDAERDGKYAPKPDPSDYGRCVYLGADSASQKSVDSSVAELNCSNKYDMTGSCKLINEVTTPCEWTDATGVKHYQAPNRGTAQLAGTKSGSTIGLQCIRKDPSSFCSAPYSGGTWTADVEIDATCSIKKSQEFTDMVVK